MMRDSSRVFAKLPTGELVVVLSITRKKRSVTVGACRTEYRTMRMFADSLVFQHGVVQGDIQDRKWECGDNWMSFDDYFGIETSSAG